MTTKTSFMEKQKRQLVKKFHTLLGKAHIDDDGKKDILAAYGVTTSLDLECKDLIEICDRMYAMIYNGQSAEYDELNKQRRRLLAAGCKFMRINGQIESFDYVKGWACRRAKKRHFNEIPLDKLRAITYAFNHQTEELEATKQLTSQLQGMMLNQRANLN